MTLDSLNSIGFIYFLITLHVAEAITLFTQ